MEDHVSKCYRECEHGVIVLIYYETLCYVEAVTGQQGDIYGLQIRAGERKHHLKPMMEPRPQEAQMVGVAEINVEPLKTNPHIS